MISFAKLLRRHHPRHRMTAIGTALLVGTMMSSIGHGIAASPDLWIPDIVVSDFPNRTEEAYWQDNRPVAIKITPKSGAPYYIVDPDGDSEFEMRRGGTDIDVKPNNWKVLAW